MSIDNALAGTGAGGGVTPRERVIQLFPHLNQTHPDTKFQLFREFIPRKNVVEFTLFFREPDTEKVRVDAEADVDLLTQLTPEEISGLHLRITYWGSAVRF